MVKLAYVNFWKEHANDSYFTKFISFHLKENVQIVSSTANPDILIASVFGSIQNVIHTNAKVKIFFTGENVERYPPYNNKQLIDTVFHLKLGFHPNQTECKYIHFPLWLIYHSFYEGSQVLDSIQS
jgi:hypothetical protein